MNKYDGMGPHNSLNVNSNVFKSKQKQAGSPQRNAKTGAVCSHFFVPVRSFLNTKTD